MLPDPAKPPWMSQNLTETVPPWAESWLGELPQSTLFCMAAAVDQNLTPPVELGPARLSAMTLFSRRRG